MVQESPALYENFLFPIALKTLGKVLSMTVIIKSPELLLGMGREMRSGGSPEQE